METVLQINPDAVQRCVFEVVKFVKECNTSNTTTRFSLAVRTSLCVCGEMYIPVSACVCMCPCVLACVCVCVFLCV